MCCSLSSSSSEMERLSSAGSKLAKKVAAASDHDMALSNSTGTLRGFSGDHRQKNYGPRANSAKWPSHNISR